MQLRHQRLIHMQTTGGIQQHIVVAVIPRVLYCLIGNGHRVLRAHFKHRHIHLGAYHLQLLNGCGSIHIAGHQQGSVPFFLQLLCQFGRMGGFTAALQAAHHHNRRRVIGNGQPGLRAAHQLR